MNTYNPELHAANRQLFAEILSAGPSADAQQQEEHVPAAPAVSESRIVNETPDTGNRALFTAWLRSYI